MEQTKSGGRQDHIEGNLEDAVIGLKKGSCLIIAINDVAEDISGYYWDFKWRTKPKRKS